MAERIALAEAAARGGLRLVLMAGFPSPWTVAAKAIFDVKADSLSARAGDAVRPPRSASRA
jgi:hypothetical protein